MTACPNCGSQNAEGVKFCPDCGQNLVGTMAAPRETRRTVTVLFADVTGSTALGERLDPESLRTLMGRYFAAIKEIIERHGGTVEKFIGDAVMAIFGIPSRHEDDALRAVRAATEIRDTLALLNEELQRSRGLAIVFRTGVNTGEVVTGDPSAGQTLVTGDTVNTAARLEQAAQPGDILLGQTTYRLVRDAVVVEAIEPIEAKGKAEPVPAYRLRSVIAGAAGHARRLDAPIVGRERELELLANALDRCIANRAGELVSLLGEAGVGKSRLVGEFRRQFEGRATFLMGRCLSYGEGITYWPLSEALRSVVDIDDEKPLESWHTGLSAMIGDQPQAEAIVEQVMSLIGVGGASVGSDAFWAVRRLLEGVAQDRPLVFVIDDMHWATPTFLDLVEYLAGWSRDASILSVCLARPVLLEARPGWGGSGRANTATVLLEPLDAVSIDRQIAQLLGGASMGVGLRRRIAAAAEGNPLFVEELVAMLTNSSEAVITDGGDMGSPTEPAELKVPPTIEALIAARLDQLPGQERAVLERGSVIGMQFGARELAHLGDDSVRAFVRSGLMALVRRDLLLPDPEATLPGGADDEAYRFRHQLIRDGAYAGMSKAERARLHERYASLLEEVPAEQLGQLDEVVGYHLEQASLLWAALGGEPPTPDLARRAARHLGSAGLRAYERFDWAAAANLLARATALLPPTDPQRIASLPPLAEALKWLGHFDEAQAAIGEAIDSTSNGSDPATRVKALLSRARLADLNGATASQLKPDLDEALAIAQRTGDPAQLASTHADLGRLARNLGRPGDARREFELVRDAAQRSGDLRRQGEARLLLSEAMLWGTSPVADIDRMLADNLAWARENGRRRLEADMLGMQAVEAALHGRIPEARRLSGEGRAILEEIGELFGVAATASVRGRLEFLAGDAGARERALREGYDMLSAMGERSVLSTIAAELADALLDVGRIDEVEAMCTVAADAGAEDDMETQVRVGLVRGRLAARHGRMDEALALVADALALSDKGEYYDLRAPSLLLFAQLLLDAGRVEEARAHAQQVLDLARLRGDVLFESRATDLLNGFAVSGPAAN